MSTEPETTDGSTEASPYIRTFAKDFAALSAQNPELAKGFASKHKKKISPPPKIFEKKKVEPKKQALTDLDSEAKDIDERTRDGLFSMPTTSDQRDRPESIELPKIDPGDIVQQVETPALSVTPVQPLTPPTPVVFTPPAPITPESSGPSDEERAAILARLKTKAAAAAQQESEITPSVIVPKVPEIQKPQIIPEISAPIIPAYPVSKIEKPPEAVPLPIRPEIKPDEKDPSPIHTYRSDFSDHVEEKNASTFSIIAAEKDSGKQSVPKPARSPGRLLPVVIGIMLLLIGIGAVFAAYAYMSKNAPVVLSQGSSSLIAPDARAQLNGSGFILMEALADKANEPLANNSVLLTYVDAATTTSDGVTEAPSSGGAFITELNLAAPDILLRNIDPSSMVGIVHAGTQTSAFFILRVTSYERTFAGMLQWEPTMLDTLKPLYPLYPSTQTQTAVTANQSATSTVPAKIFIPPVDPTAPASQFIDEVVENHSVRALKDNAGRTLVLYGYADKQTLIIARDESAFSLLLSRLAASGN